MRRIKINPKYEHLRSYIESIPDVFEQEGCEIYNKRNLIKVLTAPDGTQINVKRYHVPHGPNRLIYSWGIREPKGERALAYPISHHHPMQLWTYALRSRERTTWRIRESSEGTRPLCSQHT